MPSQTEICNLALMRLGEPSIMSINEQNKRANALKSCFDLVRDMVLQDHPWNFAIKRTSLAKLTAVPESGYANSFQLPTDCLRVLGLVGDGHNVDITLNYKIEGQQLQTDENVAQIKYIARITDTGRFTARFCSVLAARLALEISYSLVKSPNLQQMAMKVYQTELSAAKALDAQEDSPEVYQCNPWIEARG